MITAFKYGEFIIVLIIPITLVLAFVKARQAKGRNDERASIKKIFPFFILYFVGVSVITTVAVNLGVSSSVFVPLKELNVPDRCYY